MDGYDKLSAIKISISAKSYLKGAFFVVDDIEIVERSYCLCRVHVTADRRLQVSSLHMSYREI